MYSLRSVLMPIAMLAAGLLVTGTGLLGLSGSLDGSALRWLGLIDGGPVPDRTHVLNRAIFALVTLSGSMLVLGGIIDLPLG